MTTIDLSRTLSFDEEGGAPMLHTLADFSISASLDGPSISTTSLRKKAIRALKKWVAESVKSRPLAPTVKKASWYKKFRVWIQSGEGDLWDTLDLIDEFLLVQDLYEGDRPAAIGLFVDVLFPCAEVDGYRSLQWHIVHLMLSKRLYRKAIARTYDVAPMTLSRLLCGEPSYGGRLYDIAERILDVERDVVDIMIQISMAQEIAYSMEAGGVEATLRDLLVESITEAGLAIRPWCKKHKFSAAFAEAIINDAKAPKEDAAQKQLAKILGIDEAGYKAAARLLILECAADAMDLRAPKGPPISYQSELQMLLRSEYEESGCTFAAFSKQLDIPISTLRPLMYEANNNPRPKTKMAVARFFQMPYREVNRMTRSFSTGDITRDNHMSLLLSLTESQMSRVISLAEDLVERDF